MKTSQKFPIILMIVFAFSLSAITIATLYAQKQFWQKQDYQHIITDILHHNKAAIKTFEHAALFTQKQILEDERVAEALVYTYTQQSLDPIAIISNTYEESIETIIFQKKPVYRMLKDYYDRKIEHALTAHHFNNAFVLIKTLKTKYPNDRALSNKYQAIQKLKKKRLSLLIQQYMTCLEDVQAPLLKRTQCMAEARDKIERVGIDHRLPNDPNLPAMYAEEMNKALTHKNYPHAEKILLDWQHLITTSSPQRDLIKQQLRLHQDIKNIISDLTRHHQGNIVKRLTQLSIVPVLQNEILDMPRVQNNLLRYHLNEALALMTIQNVNIDPMTEIRMAEVLTTTHKKRTASSWIPPTTPLSDSSSPEIIKLLKECQIHYAENRLTTGKSGTALACYQNVLEQSPGNLDAIKGLKSLENRYTNWAKIALKQKKLHKVQKYLQGLTKVNPYSSDLAQLKQQLEEATAPLKPADDKITRLPPAQTCDKCTCSALIGQLSMGVTSLTAIEKQFFQKECR